MGRTNGVRPASKTSIEIDFYYHGVRCKERLKLKPTPANLKRAERHRAAILDAIERGTFDYAVTFPNSPRGALFSHEPGAALPLRDYLDRWLKEIRGSILSIRRYMCWMPTWELTSTSNKSEKPNSSPVAGIT